MSAGKYFSKNGQFKIVLCAALLGTLTGCAGHNDRPRQGGSYVAPPGAGPVFIGQDDYFYYPGYECYYSVRRNQYVYRENNAWVLRPAPRSVPVRVLRASPSVKMDFHDSPANHNAEVVQQYPKNWSAPGSSRGQNGDPENYQPNKDH
jgi:hypothetical protein